MGRGCQIFIRRQDLLLGFFAVEHPGIVLVGASTGSGAVEAETTITVAMTYPINISQGERIALTCPAGSFIEIFYPPK